MDEAVQEPQSLGQDANLELPPEMLAELLTMGPEKLAKLKQQLEQAKEKEVPEVHLLMSLQKNLFCDAAFQAMALAMLGTAFTNNPELNNPELYADQSFGVANNGNWSNYACGSALVYTCDLADMPADMAKGVKLLADKIRTLIATTRIVMGTLRAYAHYNPQQARSNFSISLVWIEEKTK